MAWSVIVERELRPCLVYSLDHKNKRKALFHGIFRDLAVVEFEDGTMAYVESLDYIRFLDSTEKFNAFAWKEENHEQN